MARPRSDHAAAWLVALAMTCAACDRKASGGGEGSGKTPELAVPPPPVEPPLPELEPGQMPLGFLAATLEAPAQSRVLFVRRDALRAELADTTPPSLRWVSGTLDEVSGPDAVVRARRADGTHADAERVPVGVVIPMTPAEVSPGDLVLTNLDRGQARRAWVVPGGAPGSPSVRLLDDDLESGAVPAPVTLEAGTFRPVSGDHAPGAWVASTMDGALVPGMVVARSGDALLLRGFGGALRADVVGGVRAASRALPSVGDPVLAPYLGRYLPAEVTGADASTGRVTVSLTFLGDPVRSTHGVGSLLASPP